jgi:hypothetical protein
LSKSDPGAETHIWLKKVLNFEHITAKKYVERLSSNVEREIINNIRDSSLYFFLYQQQDVEKKVAYFATGKGEGPQSLANDLLVKRCLEIATKEGKFVNDR